MSKSRRTMIFNKQMAQAAGELRSIMSLGESPTGDGRLTVRTIGRNEDGGTACSWVGSPNDS